MKKIKGTIIYFMIALSTAGIFMEGETDQHLQMARYLMAYGF